MMPASRKIALGAVGLGAILLGVSLLRAPPRRPVRAIDAVPSDAFIAIDLNVGALRKSGALGALFGDRNEQSLTAVCGFDPVDKMEDLVFTVPEDGNGAFGVAVQADLTQKQLLGCAAEVVKAHGGDAESDTVTRGLYEVLTPRRISSDSSKPGRSIAYSAGNPILVGPKTWLYSMIDAVGDVSEGHASSSQHVTLRARLAEGLTPPPTFLLTATALLDKGVREKLKTEMMNEVGSGSDPGSAMMIGVLGMSSAVLGLYETGEDVRFIVQLRCEQEPECAQVEKLIVKVKDEWSRLPALRLLGLGPVLDHVTARHDGTKLEVRTTAATSDVVRWAKLFIASRPIVGPVDSAQMAAAMWPQGSAAPALSADVPTQTVHVAIPEGVEPGQPFTVRLPSPTGAGSSVRTLQAVPGGPPPRTSAPHAP